MQQARRTDRAVAFGGVSDSIMISGHSVPVEDAQRLVTTLIVDGTPTALGVANRLTTCLQMNVEVELDAQERTAVLAVLEDPPDGLAGLRGALARDHRERTERPQARCPDRLCAAVTPERRCPLGEPFAHPPLMLLQQHRPEFSELLGPALEHPQDLLARRHGERDDLGFAVVGVIELDGGVQPASRSFAARVRTSRSGTGTPASIILSNVHPFVC